jgi:hypothetical protein
MVNRLLGGDIPNALKNIGERSRERYATVLNAVGPVGLAQYFETRGSTGLGGVTVDYSSENRVELFIAREIEGQWYGYRVYVMRGGDGLWRIVEM